MDLIGALVLVPHGELLQLGGDVIRSPAVDVPVGVDAVVHLRRPSRLGVGLVVLLKMMPVDVSLVPFLLAHLTDWFGGWLSTGLGRRWRVAEATSTEASAKTPRP